MSRIDYWPLVRAILWLVVLTYLVVLSIQEGNAAYAAFGVLLWGVWFWRD